MGTKPELHHDLDQLMHHQKTGGDYETCPSPTERKERCQFQ